MNLTRWYNNPIATSVTTAASSATTNLVVNIKQLRDEKQRKKKVQGQEEFVAETRGQGDIFEMQGEDIA